MIGATEIVAAGAYVTGFLGLLAAVLAYVVNRRSVAVVELESSLKNLREDNDDLREELRSVRRELDTTRQELSETRSSLRNAEERIHDLERKGMP